MKDKKIKNFIHELEKLKKAQLAKRKESVGNLFGADTKLILKAYTLEQGNFKKIYPQLLHQQNVLEARLKNLSEKATTKGGVMAYRAATTMALSQIKIVDELVEKYAKLYAVIFSDDSSVLTNLTDDQILDFAFVTEVTKILYNMHDTLGYSAYDSLFVLFEQLETRLENNPTLQDSVRDLVEYLSALAQKEAEMAHAFNAEVSKKLQELEQIKIDVPEVKEFKPLPPNVSRLDSPKAPSSPEKKTTTKPTPKPEQKTDEKPKASDGASVCLDGLLPEEKPKGAIKEL